MTQPVSTSELLALELEALNAPPRLIKAARRGDYSDFRSSSTAPKTDLFNILTELGYTDLATRVVAGEFNDTRAEFRAWFKSVEGHQALRQLFPAITRARWQDIFGGN